MPWSVLNVTRGCGGGGGSWKSRSNAFCASMSKNFIPEIEDSRSPPWEMTMAPTIVCVSPTARVKGPEISMKRRSAGLVSR